MKVPCIYRQMNVYILTRPERTWWTLRLCGVLIFEDSQLKGYEAKKIVNNQQHISDTMWQNASGRSERYEISSSNQIS